MIKFPKKYKTQDLHNWAKKYRDSNLNNTDQNYIFSISSLPISYKMSYKDFFKIYINSFFIHKKNIENNQTDNNLKLEQLFIIEWNQLNSICNSYKFFQKKNQTLSQVWNIKLKRHMVSQAKKNFNANKKILNDYLSSSHKLYIQDSEMYLYILEKFQQLRNNWKISMQTKIWYRSFNLQTTIPNHEILRKEENIPYYVIKYFVGAKCEALPVCVQDIDLCCWDVALLVHPKDKRYNKYIWRNAIIPLCNRQIPIIWDENVNIAINNWIKRICPCASEESIELAKKYWLPTNIFVFNKQWFYTEYIHEQAFIWQERNKYYENIVWFIKDIWNLAIKWEKTVKIPYLKYTNEYLVPYQIEEIIIDIKEEKEKILNKIYEWKISISFSNKIFEEKLEELERYQKSLDNIFRENWNNIENLINQDNHNYEIENIKSNIFQIKQDFSDLIKQYLPDYIVWNSQLPYWWRIPTIKNKNWETHLFNIETYIEWQKKSPQNCFNIIILSLVNAWILWIKSIWKDSQEYKICEYDKIFTILSQNEKIIENFIKYFSNKFWEQEIYNKILEIIQNLTNENNSSINECTKLIENCKFIKQEWVWILLNIEWLPNDIINPEFYQSCISSYLNDKNIKINNQIFINENEINKTFEELLAQELLLWKTLFNEIIEFPCNKNNETFIENLWNKIQINQSQQEIISSFWENPIRLNLLIDQTYDPEKILLNSIFLKQIRNSIRLCIQKNFLPKNIKTCLSEQQENFEDFDVLVLYKLNELYDDFINIKSYEEYINFFNDFKKIAQNIFFSRYLEIQKINPSQNTQFVCSYFFNFLLTLLYPLIPEFIESIQYISNKEFVFPIKSVILDKSIDYNINTLYNTFLKIKEIKFECNIKQHEPCNIFIKSNPSVLEFFINNDLIFKNYFHISEILYLRLHEQTPLWYDIFEENELTIWIQSENTNTKNKKETIETLERDIKNLEDKLQLIRQRLQILPEWKQHQIVEEEYRKTKEEMENLAIKHSLLNSK